MRGSNDMKWSSELIASIVIPVLLIIVVSGLISTGSRNEKVNSAKADLSNEHLAQNSITGKIDIAVDIITRENQRLQQQVFLLQQENAALKKEIDRLNEDNSESDEWEQ